MLGWALKKGFQGATGLRDAPEGGDDTTQIDVPDTPAPVFAARAIKNAIWGHSAGTEAPAKMLANETKRVETAPNATTTDNAVPIDTRSPTKLNSILLTPGTGTSRRKRVSFGRDVKADNNVDSNPLGASSSRNSRPRKKTAIQQALENSRVTKNKTPEPQVQKPEDDDTEEDGEWEDEDVCCNHDLTVDLNEPHSESGKYWKAEWSRYREEAKADIEQLVKYKANARSFAAKKDMEASQLSQKLKEEQSKVVEMEKQIADMTAKLATTRGHGTEEDSASMTKDLARQTTLVAEYRERIKNLETRLKEASSEANRHRHIDTSPRTEQSILEVSRELRKARSDLRQMDRLRDEVKRLKSSLARSRERVEELEARASTGQTSESSREVRLEKQLREVKEASRQKDTDIRKLKRDYETLKMDAKSRTAEALQVLQDKNTRIGELEKKIKELEAAHASEQAKTLDAAITEHRRITRGLKSDMEARGKASNNERVRPTNRRARAASVEDLTLDMTQRSLFKDEDDYALNDLGRGKGYAGDRLTEWTADIPTLELQVRDKAPRQEEAYGRNENPITADTDDLPTRREDRADGRRSHYGDRRAMSDVPTNRVNESSRRRSRSRTRQLADTNGTSAEDHNRIDSNRGTNTSARTASVPEDKATMHGALDSPTRRSRFASRTSRPISSDGETPAFDLVQNRFSRLGGPSADRSATGNTSRCALPPDRKASALARLAQKKMEKRKASGRGLDKENVKP